MLQNWSDWFLVQEVQTLDAPWISSYSADCRGMHHTLIITANVRGSLATGSRGLSRHTNIHTRTITHTCTQKHATSTATRLSCKCICMHICVCVCYKVSLCVDVYLLLSIFLISQIGPGFCLRRRKQREGWCAALCCSCPSHTSAHTHPLTLSFSKVTSTDSVLILMWPLMSFKSNCPPTWCPRTHTRTWIHSPSLLYFSWCHFWWRQIRTLSQVMSNLQSSWGRWTY